MLRSKEHVLTTFKLEHNFRKNVYRAGKVTDEIYDEVIKSRNANLYDEIFFGSRKILKEKNLRFVSLVLKLKDKLKALAAQDGKNIL